MTYWVIRSKDTRACWNKSSIEWGNGFEAKLYSDADKQERDEDPAWNIGLDNEWAELWLIDEIQFARLIDEIMGSVDITTDCLVALCASMDLELAELDEIVTRARSQWEYIKDRVLEKELASNDPV